MSLLNDNLNMVKNFNPKDQLFKTEDKDLWMSANLNILGKEEKYYIYATGYFEAAKIIYQNLDSQKRYHDILVYPIIYLFRQSIELLMKDIIKTGYKLIHNTDKYFDRHELINLWNEVLEILNESKIEHNTNDIEVITSLINEFDKIDPRSTAFRYPEKINGEESLYGINHINLDTFYTTACKICNYLIGIDSILAEQLSTI